MKKGNYKSLKFNEEEHRYFYGEKEMFGVTGVISSLQNLQYGESSIVSLAQSYGSQVHKEVENCLNVGGLPVTESGKYVMSVLESKARETTIFRGEVLVSDFESTVSSIDIVQWEPGGVILYDIKTGEFKREYCTLQLNAYRRMYENTFNEKVKGMFVINTKDKRVYKILACEDVKTDVIFNRNKDKKFQSEKCLLCLE